MRDRKIWAGKARKVYIFGLKYFKSTWVDKRIAYKLFTISILMQLFFLLLEIYLLWKLFA